MKHTTTKILALILAAVMLTAASPACGSKENTGGGLGDFVVGGTSSGEPTNSKPPSQSSQEPRGSVTDDPRIIGTWYDYFTGSRIGWTFNEDGTCALYYNVGAPSYLDSRFRGSYTLKNGVLSGKHQHSQALDTKAKDWGPWGKMEPFYYDETLLSQKEIKKMNK